MKFEIRNVRFLAANSEETHCFSATVYGDGKRLFGVKNEGRGGPNTYYPVDGLKHNEVWNLVAAIDRQLNKEEIDGGGFKVNNCLEIVIGELMNAWLAEREARRFLKKIVYAHGTDVFALPAKFKPTTDNLKAVKSAKWWNPEYVLLNELPIEQASKYISGTLAR